VKRPAGWILLTIVSIAASCAAYYYFPKAFSIVALDIRMDRERALEEARRIMARDRFEPSEYRQAASFALDGETQTFVELEGGGKDAFTRMLRDELYAAYTWRVRQFQEGETNETLIRFTPAGLPYGFVERLREDAPGAALPADAARRIGEAEAAARWRIDFRNFEPIEHGQERRTTGRIDHTFTYERPSPTLSEGRYRLRLVVSGDRLTEVTHFVMIPQAFSRRYENMRSANNAIGSASVVGVMLLYVVGGIGIGLFFMLRASWVIWRPAAIWGVAVGLAQALAAINNWPLLWMTYDTALPRSTFLAQQITTMIAMFIGSSVFFALSFIAAETLTRRAFGSHPQLWRVWAKGPGSSTAILSRTAKGYLLVSVFFAYDVVLYLVATRAFGWWTPSEALLHPDVLATYLPWLSAIANSFQAGFWEECLFRAVPLAGAALIGDRFGQRRLFLVIGFAVQAIIFGAGHAPYPTQPSFARPVELIIPSIGFGLLYIWLGLLPGIVLHYTFDVVWFALPIFLADAPGIWRQQFMVVIITLVPLWIVWWRRVQAGRWTALAPSERNIAWTPPAAPEQRAPSPVFVQSAVHPRAKTAWFVVGALSLAACVWAIVRARADGALHIRRVEAAAIARRALEQRGVTLGSQWRLLPRPDEGRSGEHEFVGETAGEARRRELTGTYLPAPRWIVRVATFEGDVAERAEEWHVFVADTRDVQGIHHTLPEARPGASLDEDPARQLAQQALTEQLHPPIAPGKTREVSARPSKLKARTDWTFTFVDTAVPPLPKGEPRISVDIAGDEVARVARFVYVPEGSQRQQRAAATRNLVMRIVSGVVFGGLLVASAVAGIVAWSRRRYAPRLFLAAASLMFVASLANAANGWPSILAMLQTAQPFQLQVLALVGIGLVSLTLTSVLVGLAMGALPHRLSSSGHVPDRDALQLGVVVGLFGAAVSALAAWLRTPPWAHFPTLGSLGTFVPMVDLVVDPVLAFLMRMAVVLSVLAGVTLASSTWTRRRTLAAAVIVAVGFLSAGAPSGSQLAGWLTGGLLTGAGLLVAYVSVVRSDLTMVPIALGTMVGIGALAQGIQRPFPGAFGGSAVAALAVVAIAWWSFIALRRAAAGVRSQSSTGPESQTSRVESNEPQTSPKA
jgi:hypothetical protein